MRYLIVIVLLAGCGKEIASPVVYKPVPIEHVDELPHYDWLKAACKTNPSLPLCAKPTAALPQ